MTRRERIERRLAEARNRGREYPFGTGDGYRDVEAELQALWAIRDAAREIVSAHEEGVMCYGTVAEELSEQLGDTFDAYEADNA